MSEYVIYVAHDHKGKAPEDWQEQVKAHRGVSESSGDLNGIVVKCDDEIAEKLRKKFSYLNIEYIMTEEDYKNGV